MRDFREFNCLMKRQDNEILGKEGEEYESKIMIDILSVVAFWETEHESTKEKGTGIEMSGGTTSHLMVAYGDFTKIMKDSGFIYHENS